MKREIQTEETLEYMESVAEAMLGDAGQMLQQFLSQVERILKSNLWINAYETEADYCQNRWNLSQRRIQEIRSAEGTRRQLLSPEESTSTGEQEKKRGMPRSNETVVNKTTQRAIRELTPLKSEPDAMKAAFQQAAKVADGKPPTAKQIRQAVDLQTPVVPINGRQTPVRVEKLGPAEGDDSQPDEEWTDEEWLERFTNQMVRAGLPAPLRQAFDCDAVLYHHMVEARREFQNKLRRHAGGHLGVKTGAYHDRLRHMLETPHPKEWLLCGQCKGGRGHCTRCHGRGYVLPYPSS